MHIEENRTEQNRTEQRNVIAVADSVVRRGTIRKTKTNPIYTHSVHTGDLADQKGGATQLDCGVVRHQLSEQEESQNGGRKKQSGRERTQDKKLKVHFLRCRKRWFKKRNASKSHN